MMATKRNITDRAKRYRAQQNVPGPKRCVICGSTSDLQAMHLSGDENHGEKENLAWGCRSCNQKLSAAFKAAGSTVRTEQYNPGKKGVPTFENYMWAVTHHKRGAHDEGGAVIHATPRHKRIEYAGRIAESRRGRSAAALSDRWNPGDKSAPYFTKAEKLEADAARGEQLGGSPKVIADLRARAEAFRAKGREVQSRDNPRRGKRNPAGAASEAFEEFHGRGADETIKVTRSVHFHQHLAGAGKLVSLEVLGVDGQNHLISRFKGALLCFNEARNQLFIEGGDQKMNLSDFGISKPHELETLGKVKAIDYQTDKHHLGDEGGNAVYAHTFRTTNQNGRHVTVKIARYPDLIYRVMDEQLEFSGGSYTIRAEGIDK